MPEVKKFSDCLGSITKFLKPGDLVDDDFVDYFIEILPPACMNSKCVQIGEPYDHDERMRPRFMTVEKIGGQWTYTGLKIKQGDVQ